MLICGCIGDLCQLPAVDQCYVFWGGGCVLCGCGMLAVFSRSIYIYICICIKLVKFEYVSFPIGMCDIYVECKCMIWCNSVLWQ